MRLFLQAFQVSPAYFYTVVGVFGLVIGSFLNVVALRVPKGMSILHPPSHCCSCGHRLGPLDLIPVISWLLSRGKCRYCGEPYSLGYALWEALTCVCFLLTAAVLGPSKELLVGLLLVSLLIPLVQVDLRHMLLPDKIVFFGMGSGAVARLLVHPEPIWHYALAFAAGGGLLYLIAEIGDRLLKKESMGGGDIKLMAMLGVFLGLKGIVLTLFLGSFIGLVISLMLIGLRLVRADQAVPFGPYLAAGALTAYLFGEPLIHGYISLFLS